MLATLIYALALEPRTEAKEPTYTSKECVASDVRRTNKKGAVYFDLSNCRSLDVKCASGDELDGANDAKALALALSRPAASSVGSLRVWDCALGDDGAAELVDALFKNAAVHGLELSNCSLGDAGARSIAGLLRKGYGGEGAAYQPQLTTLDLSDNAIGIEGARALASALALNEHRLEDVSLSGNDDIGDDGAVALGAALAAQSRDGQFALNGVALTSCGIGARGAAAIALALLENSRLETIDLAENPLGDRGARALALALRSSVAAGGGSRLQVLDLTSCGVTSGGARELLDAARLVPTLRVLEVFEESDSGAIDDELVDEIDALLEMSEAERAQEKAEALEALEAAADGDDAPTLDMASVAALLRAQVEGRLQEMEERRAAQSGEAKSEL